MRIRYEEACKDVQKKIGTIRRGNYGDYIEISRIQESI